MDDNNWEALKRQAAYRACDYIEDGMNLGLGSGSTVFYVFEKLRELMQNGMQIQAVCSSMKTEALAREVQIPILKEFADIRLDLNIDGLDQIDTDGNVIKGGGAALTREKMLAQWAKKTIWIMDERKLVDCLDTYVLPVEILPFCHEHMISYLQQRGYEVKERCHNNELLISDNGGYILDVHLPQDITMKQAHDKLIQMAGVIETGYFEQINAKSVVAGKEGCYEINFSLPTTIGKNC